MTKDELQKVRDALVEAPHDIYPNKYREALAILDAALAAPEQEPVADRTAWLVELVAGPFAPAWLSAATVENGWTKDANAAISFPSKEVAIDVFERLMETRRWRSLGLGRDCYKITEHMFIHAAQSCHSAPQPEQEPFAWATFDGDGSYDLRLYECNENYRDDYLKRNGDKYAGWVEPLYRHPALQSAQPVAQKLRDELLFEIGNYWECAYCEGDSGISRGDQANKILAKITDLIARLTAPPSHEWQDLSPLEMRDVLRNCAASTFDKLAPNWYEVRQFARAIEAALRAKNTGEQA